MFAADGAVFLYEKLKHRLILAHYKTAFLIIVGLAISLEAYIAYFGVWIKSPVTADSFNAGYVAIGREINQLPPEEDKYVVVRRGGVDVRGVPMPAQTVMFITDSFLPQIRKQKHIHYLLPAEYEAEKEAIGTAPTFFLD
jgi:hypothetical protein